MKQVSQNLNWNCIGEFAKFTCGYCTLALLETLAYLLGRYPPSMFHVLPGTIPGSVLAAFNIRKLAPSYRYHNKNKTIFQPMFSFQ